MWPVGESGVKLQYKLAQTRHVNIARMRDDLTTWLVGMIYCTSAGGAENAGQDIAGQDNDGQEKHHAWVEIKT